MHFIKLQSKNILAQYPETTHKTLLKKAHELWNLMTDQDKEYYENIAKQDKERYIKELKEYKKANGSVYRDRK